MSNASVLKKSIKEFERIKRAQIMPTLTKLAYTLLEDALSMRSGWAGFTGNLPTSYAAAVWDFDGKLFGDIIFAEDVDGYYNMSTIIRRKIEYGEVLHLSRPWEGDERTHEGKAKIVMKWGPDLADWFLRNFTPTFYPSICICTGAEYSKIVEDSYGPVLETAAKDSFVRKVGDMVFAGSVLSPEIP